MIGFSPNISLLWPELDFAQRVRAAHEAGYTAVEFWPSSVDDECRRAISRSGMEVVSINVDPGPPGSVGLLADPEARSWWQAELDRTVRFAGEVGCTTVNVLVGNRLPRYDRELQLATAAQNLADGLERIDGSGVDLVLEPLCADREAYLLRTVTDARALHDAAGGPEHLKLLFDFYHLSQTESRPVTDVFGESIDLVKHVQLADVPGRGEPGSGTIDWAAVQSAIEASGYDGHIGLEFVPAGSTEEALLRTHAVWGAGALA